MPVSGDAAAAEHVQRAAAENGGEQRHDGEGRRGREGQAVGRAEGARLVRATLCVHAAHRTRHHGVGS